MLQLLLQARNLLLLRSGFRGCLLQLRLQGVPFLLKGLLPLLELLH
jgi:hypothetical protein